MELVIGLVGRIASGKGFVSDYLAGKHGARVYRFSDVLRDVLELLNQPNTRENLQALGSLIREAFGDDVLADALKRKIVSDDAGVVVVDGIRYWNELEMVRGFKPNLVLAVQAPLEVRYGRVLSRATRGEGRLSLDDFRNADSMATERFVDEICGKADVLLDNGGSRESLVDALEKALEGRL